MLSAKRFGLAAGIVWGGAVFLFTLYGILFPDYGESFFAFFDFYPGFERSPSGAALGLLWGFIDGLVGGSIFVWVYNHLKN